MSVNRDPQATSDWKESIICRYRPITGAAGVEVHANAKTYNVATTSQHTKLMYVDSSPVGLHH